MSAKQVVLSLALVFSWAAVAWPQPGASAPSSQPATSPATGPASKPAAAAGWMESMDEAVKQAKASNKLILSDFTGTDWCIWCKRLKAEVFDTKAFKDWAAKNVVLLELDYPRNKTQSDAVKKQNKELLKKYKIEGFPTILFLKADGEEAGRTGYVKGGPGAWLPEADKILKGAAK